jgi:hypothetical protein
MKENNHVETSLNMPVSAEFIERRILFIRGQKVILDSVLAELYHVETKNLTKAVKRNIERFPRDFMFQLDKNEMENLRFQFGTSSWGGRRYTPYVFTELGVAMLSSVLKSDRAVQMNIYIMRAFVQLRELLATHKDLAEKIQILEKEQKEQGKDITAITIALNKLLMEKSKLPSAMGFRV